MMPIAQVAHRKLGINLSDLLLYGHYKAKISLDYLRTLEQRPNAKLILVTAITPTAAGEGNVSVGSIAAKAQCLARVRVILRPSGCCGATSVQCHIVTTFKQQGASHASKI